jgi:serine/threonine protein kinase
LDQLVPLALQLCSALHYMHGQNMVHLDIKPKNIIMGSPPRLIDLSIARSCGDAERLRIAIGTDGYMAPEQHRPNVNAPVGPPADVWGLGVTLHEAVSGRLPFSKGAAGIQDAILAGPLSLGPRVPQRVAEVIGECLAFEPADRPAPREVTERLEPVLAEMPRRLRLTPRRPSWSVH